MSAAIDPGAAAFVVIAVGADPATAERARGWTAQAEAIAPTTLLLRGDSDAPADLATLGGALDRARTGARFLLTGGRYDVLQCAARLRDHGVLPVEITAVPTRTDDLPIWCAHCRERHRVVADPGHVVACPGCRRELEVHDHLAGTLGCYLASDSRAAELVP